MFTLFQDRVKYHNDGTAYFSQYRVIHTVCELDVKYFPFDKQTCEISTEIADFGSGYNYQIFPLLRTLFDGDGLWDIVHKQARVGNRNTVKINFEFKRKPLYILLNVLLPIYVLAVLTPVVFLLPIDERIGFSVSTLLAISVYMTIVSSYLPQKSDPLPLMSILIITWYMMNAFMIFVVIYNVKIYAREPSMPLTMPAARLIKFYKCIGRKRSKVKITEDSSYDGSELVNFSTSEGDKPTWQDVSEAIDKPACQDVGEPNYKPTWRDVSEAIDMIAIVSVYIIDVLITLVFILL